MEMTPEKLAFIKGQPEKESKGSKSEAAATPAGPENVIEIERPKDEGEAPKSARPKVSRRSSRGSSRQGIPEPSELLDQVLVPVTIRLPRRTAQALARAYLEQRLKHAKPDTQQEIADEALTDWLVREGYLD